MFWKDIPSSIDHLLTQEVWFFFCFLFWKMSPKPILFDRMWNSKRFWMKMEYYRSAWRTMPIYWLCKSKWWFTINLIWFLAYIFFSLTKEETITELISIIITEPLVTENVLEQYKLPNTVCEILTFNGNKFSTIIVEERYLCQLWSFLELKNDNQCLNPLLASFFSKLFLYILSQHTEQVLDFISSRQEPNDFVSVALRNISVSAIMDFVFKCWEYTNLYEKVSADKMESFNNVGRICLAFF